MLRVVPVYAALLAILFAVLALRVIRIRTAERVTLGVGRSRILERQIRVHANFAEYVPFCLLLLVMAEWRGAPALALHALGAALLASRVLHVLGMGREPEQMRLRQLGMIGTISVMLFGAASILLT